MGEVEENPGDIERGKLDGVGDGVSKLDGAVQANPGKPLIVKQNAGRHTKITKVRNENQEKFWM